MDKISHQQVKALLKQAGSSIRVLTENLKEAQEKIASFEKEERIRKVASQMEEKHLSADLSYEEKVAQLRTAKNLNVVEEAVKISSHQGMSLGKVAEDFGGDVSDARSALETFIYQGDAPE